MGEGSTDTPQGVGHGGGREASLPANHVPVLLKEAIDFLNVRRGGTYIDATVGLGGHSYEIAKRLGAPGHLIGLDKDPAALEVAGLRLRASSSQPESDWPTITLLHRSFAEIAKGQRPATIDGILADIGVSSLQLQDAARGFSFQADGPLDMRMDPRVGANRRTSGKPPRRARACRCDLRIRRGKEVAENRQSHCPVAADTIYRTSCGCHISRGPANEFRSRRRIHPATQNFSSSSNLRKPRTGRSEGAAGSGAADSEARRTRGGDQFSLVGRSHRKGCLPRGRK